MAPVLPTLLRMAGRGGKIQDDFNRSLTGSLGSTSLGALSWTIVTGTWDVNGARPTTATSLASNPLATVQTPVSDFDASLLLGAGDALYFRVQDATNWWRVLYEGFQTSSCQTCCSTCCNSTCCSTCSSTYGSCSAASCGDVCNVAGCGNNCPTSCGTCNRYSCVYECNCYGCDCYSCNCTSCNCVYTDNYRLLTQKMIGGTLTTVHTGDTVTGSGNATATARVVASGTTLTSYRGATQQYNGAGTELATQVRHGIGRGASNYNSMALDDFVLTWK